MQYTKLFEAQNQSYTTAVRKARVPTKAASTAKGAELFVAVKLRLYGYINERINPSKDDHDEINALKT